MNKTVNWLIEVLYLISSLVMAILLIVLLYSSMLFWNDNIPKMNFLNFNAQMWSIAVLIAVVTITVQWIEGRIRAIIKSWNRLKGGSHGRKRKDFSGDN